MRRAYGNILTKNYFESGVRGKDKGLRIKGKDRRQTSEVGGQKTESRN